MVVKDIERTDIEFICKSLKCVPIAHVDYMTSDKLGTAEFAEDLELSDG